MLQVPEMSEEDHAAAAAAIRADQGSHWRGAAQREGLEFYTNIGRVCEGVGLLTKQRHGCGWSPHL